jgi:ABC-2 type transport system permease protein
MTHVRVILWAQWRAARSMLPRSGPWAWILSAIWYFGWLMAAVVVAGVVASPADTSMVESALPGGLQLVILYWQVVPILLSATGASLDLQKLKAYPIPVRQLFGIEVLLRATAAVEMVMLLIGASFGAFYNPKLAWYSPFAFLPFILFNLFLAVGLRDLVNMLLRHPRFREIFVLLLVCVGALPTLLAARPEVLRPLRPLFSSLSWKALPWTVTASLFEGRDALYSVTVLAAWILIAVTFSSLQFRRTFRSDQELAPSQGLRTTGENGLLENFFRWPSLLFRDPLAVIVEKEIRFLARSPRFRLVFLMGFTFGLVIWLPLSTGRGGVVGKSFLGSNYLTVVSVYSLLLLSEVCFWNSFGFDRSAAQIYFLAPVRFSRVLIGKNLSALFFVSIEIAAITVVCSLMGMPVSPSRMAEAYSVAGVVGLFLLGAGNMMSVQNARAVNPDTSFRSGAPGRIQALLMVVYPVAFIPVGLAYLARYGFDSELAFYAVLGFDVLVGGVLYKLALDSAVGASERNREKMIAALSEGDGPIAA